MGEREVTVNVREYGNVIMTTASVHGQIDPHVLEAATAMMDRQTQELRDVLDICGDAEIIDNFKIIEGPNVDPLMRFKPLGWYGKFASPNYEKLEAHFKCKSRHIPPDITLEFINQMIEEYAQQQRRYDVEEDDDY